VSTRSAGSGATRAAARRACCGTTMSATSVVTNAPTLTAPMNTGRRAAFRARALIHAARGAPKIMRRECGRRLGPRRLGELMRLL
jgi:hypothetical protein